MRFCLSMTSPGFRFTKTMFRLLWLLVILSCSLAQASLPRDGLLTATRSGWLTVAGSFGGQLSSLYVNTNRAELYSDATFATAQGLSLANGYNQFVTAGTNAAGALVLSTVTTNWLPVTVSFSYDLNGNLVSDGQKSYEYDRANQLTSVTLPGEWRTEYAYDGLGRRRISREYTWRGSWVLASEVRYVYDRMLVLQERRADNTVLATYTRGLDLSGSMQGAGGIGGLLARTDSAGSTYYHSDGGGNITSLTDSSGAVVARYLYDPFGRLLGRWGPMAEVNRYQFSSKETDRLTGLSYYGYRFYDPTLQRWLNQDPLGEGGGINLYGFVGNSPLNAVDPLGMWGVQFGGFNIGIGEPSYAFDGVWWEGTRNSWHTGLDAIGTIEPTPFADGLNGVLYGLEGDWGNAGLSMAGVVPYIGDAGKVCKYGKKAAKSEQMLFRGVPGNGTQKAILGQQGVAIPRSTALDEGSLIRHVLGEDVSAGVTSWTTDRAVATRFSGSGGTIIEVPVSKVSSQVVPRPPVPKYGGESEVLLRGTVQGTPTRP